MNLLPRIGIGTAGLGDVFGEVDDSTATAVLSRALDRGVDYFDTAPLYGNGLAERRLGVALAELGHPAVRLSTKAGRTLDDSSQGWHFDFGREAVLRGVEQSLRRLDADRLDLVFLHDPDDFIDRARSVALPALRELQAQGVIGAVGVGTNRRQTAEPFVRAADVDVVMLAGRYTLLDQSAAPQFLPLCRSQEIEVVLAGVYNSGILIDPRDGAWFDYLPATPRLLTRAREIQQVAQSHGVTLPRAALQFAAGTHPAVTSVVVGVSGSAQVDANLDDLKEPVPQKLWDELRTRRLITVAVGGQPTSSW